MVKSIYSLFTFLLTFPWSPNETEVLVREMYQQLRDQATSSNNDFYYNVNNLERISNSGGTYDVNFERSSLGGHGMVRFFLYTNKNLPHIGRELLLSSDPASVGFAGIRADVPLKILIHGFQSSYSSPFPQKLKDAYLKSGQLYNVICVDWGPLSGMTGALSPLLYPFVVENVPIVAEKVADLIQFLKSYGYISHLGLVHIIGFSLGAHAAGMAGSIVKAKSLRKIGRITGLDPAGPKYTTSQPYSRRLDPTDADFVDVIHTNTLKLGYPGQLGHIDFYPNGGKQQPNCDPNQRVGNIQGIPNIKHIFANSCSHSKAPQYFIKSITSKEVACRCSTWNDFKTSCRFTCKDKAVFGEHVALTARGKYFLEIVL